MAKIPIALQLYSVREDCARDFAGTVKAVAQMGYAGVEFAGYYDRSAAELRKLLDDLGLKAAGTHIGLETLMGDELKRTVEFNRTLGNRFLIVPGLPQERRNSRAAWLETARIMNEVAQKVEPAEMRVGYHNHWIEFQPLEGEMPWDTFFGAAKPEVVMQFDTGNAMHGGADPLTYLTRYPGRATTVHIKEFSKAGKPTVVGEGDVPWADVFRLCETTAATEWYIIEQEQYPYPPLESCRRCLENMRKMGKV